MNIIEKFGRWLAKANDADTTVDDMLALDAVKQLLANFEESEAHSLADWAIIIWGSRKYGINNGEPLMNSCGLNQIEVEGIMDHIKHEIQHRGIAK